MQVGRAGETPGKGRALGGSPRPGFMTGSSTTRRTVQTSPFASLGCGAESLGHYHWVGLKES